MPVQRCGANCYVFGHQKKYHGPDAKAKATRQGRAIAISKARAAGHRIRKGY